MEFSHYPPVWLKCQESPFASWVRVISLHCLIPSACRSSLFLFSFDQCTIERCNYTYTYLFTLCRLGANFVSHKLLVLKIAPNRRPEKHVYRLPGIGRDHSCLVSLCTCKENHWDVKCELWETAGVYRGLFIAQLTSPGWYTHFSFRFFFITITMSWCFCKSHSSI